MIKAIVHTNPRCQPCAATKRKLVALGAKWMEKPITEQSAAVWRSQGFLQAPIVEIVNEWNNVEEIFSGYRPDRLEELFKEKK